MKVYAMRMPTIRNINSPIGASVDPMDRSEFIEIDAGDVDDLLKGCGPLPPAVLSVLTLWKGGVITNGELLELVKKDIQFIQQVELLYSFILYSLCSHYSIYVAISDHNGNCQYDVINYILMSENI
jgi:hypothetical protein